MKLHPHPASARPRRGASLIEVVIAVGVLAVAVPLVFGALAESGETGIAARAETRTSWVIPACLDELHAARDGQSRFLDRIPPGKEFQNLSLAFNREGAAVGKLDPAAYDQGTRDKSIAYIASMSATLVSDPANDASTAAMRQLLVRLEFPAGAPARKRQKIDFFTRIP